MGFEEEHEESSSTSPKLLLFSQRFSKPDMQGGLTPPPHTTAATIPFQWEEAPGIQRSTVNDLSPQRSQSVRSLDLPPNMLTNSASSPTSVLQGPYSLCSPDRMVGKSKCMVIMSWSKIKYNELSSPKFSSWSCDSGSRYGSSSGSSSFSSNDLSNSMDSTIKINKVSRRRNLIFFNKTTSSILESMYQSIIKLSHGDDKILHP